MSLSCFARENTDISIMEVGMGGRLDATNVIKPLISVITNISLEHQNFLGNRLIDIAGEKAGIIKKGVDLVTGASQPSVINLFRETCEGRKATLHRVGRDFRYRSNGPETSYFGMERDLRGLRPGLAGRYQSRNTALAVAVIEILETKGYRISEKDIRDGLGDTVWPGRLQIMSGDPLVILDGAHNPGAARELADSVTGGFSYDRLIAVMGIMEDKDIKDIIRLISRAADYIICTRPDYYRAADPGRIMKEVSVMGKPGEAVASLSGAIEKAKAMASSRDLILITGSLFTVGEALTILDPVRYSPDPV
jgi:dihydrofolate synthase/folylpolyglutamate synthase